MIDWNAAKAAYLSGQSYAQVAQAMGVSASCLARRGRAEGWKQLRSETPTPVLPQSTSSPIAENESAVLPQVSPLPETENAALPQGKYAHLVRASQLLDERIQQLLEESESLGVKETAELGRALKTALEVKTVLSDKVDGPTQITVRFENPAWAE